MDYRNVQHGVSGTTIGIAVGVLLFCAVPSFFFGIGVDDTPCMIMGIASLIAAFGGAAYNHQSEVNKRIEEMQEKQARNPSAEIDRKTEEL